MVDWTAIVIALIGAVITPFVVVAVRALSRKLGVEAEASKVQIAADLARDAVSFAEQHRKNERAAGRNPSSAELLAEATGWFAAQARQHGLDAYALDYATRLIEAKLGERNEIRRLSQRPSALLDDDTPTSLPRPPPVPRGEKPTPRGGTRTS